MLSKIERKYLSGIEEFEDSNPGYAKVVRSRIRKKVEKVFADLILVVEKDQHGRQPAKEWRNRQNQKVLQKENPSEQDVAISHLRAMLNRTWRGKRQSSMIIPIWVIDLVYAVAKQDTYMADRLTEEIGKAREEFKNEHRNSLLRRYEQEWQKYGNDWLKTYLSVHSSLSWDAGFKGEDDCIAWLKKSIHPPKT